LWLLVHLMAVVQFENRLLVLLQWAWNYLTFNRTARLITGEVTPVMDSSDRGEAVAVLPRHEAPRERKSERDTTNQPGGVQA
jgi:hypothetical protein